MKSIFFTSDWHIGHANVIKFDKRPFSSVEDMHEALIRRYNAVVPVDGVCYFLGDMGNKPAEVKLVIDRLNGTKVLLRGNHDNGMGTMYNAGFDVVLDSASLHVNEQLVTMSHCPLIGVKREDCSHIKGHEDSCWFGDTRPKHLMFATEDKGQFHLHGHVHSTPEKTTKRILGRQMDVGVAGNNYTPVSWGQVVSWITTTINSGN